MNVPDFGDESQNELTDALMKWTIMPHYMKSDCILDCMRALDIEDTPDNRKCAAWFFVIGEMSSDGQRKFHDILKQLQVEIR